MTNSIHVPSCKHVLISPSFLKGVCNGNRILGWQFFFFHCLNNVVPFHSGLYRFWWEIHCHLIVSLYGTVSFLSLDFFSSSEVALWCIRVNFSGHILFRICSAAWICYFSHLNSKFDFSLYLLSLCWILPPRTLYFFVSSTVMVASWNLFWLFLKSSSDYSNSLSSSYMQIIDQNLDGLVIIMRLWILFKLSVLTFFFWAFQQREVGRDNILLFPGGVGVQVSHLPPLTPGLGKQWDFSL